jgi:hypothetical protein
MVTPALLLSIVLAAGADDQPAPIEVEVGQTFNVCKAKLIVCPVSTSICDDPKVAVVENGAEGAVVRGVAPGTTLCSVRGPGAALFRLMKVTVVAKSDPKGSAAPAGAGPAR